MEYKKSFIYLTAGGTGGHVFPAIALYEEFEKRNFNSILVTDERGIKFVGGNYKTHVINFKYNSKDRFNKIKLFFRILFKTIEIIKLFRTNKPAAVIGFGGYQSVPVLYASFLLNIPIFLYEPNSIIGKANRLFKIIAKKVFVSYTQVIKKDSAAINKFLLISPLVRSSISKIKRNNKKDDKFKICIFGGSQGASIFSKIIPESLKLVVSVISNDSDDRDCKNGLNLHITQQIIKEDIKPIAKLYKDLKISCELREFFPNIAEIYANTDLVIARSGASTLAELCVIGLPAILVPYPYATDNHQLHNAQAIEKQDGAICIEQKDFTAETLADKLIYLIQNPTVLNAMGKNLAQNKSDGVKIFVDTVEKIIK